MEDFEGIYDIDDDGTPQEREQDELELVCGYQNCCMPGYHLRSECHSPQDIEACIQGVDDRTFTEAGDDHA